ncbi:unnamed protein product [Rotaria socialis]|uniref:Uncharacterized protein n=1 Tax=Rotaria socialis TaxID=392032 RepID=A0A821XU78_9BILA|nr:unnamed protein product [Rotaria socialis]CAF4746168.1 unnamed protein product [Rotaria socialis]CAF4948138.1 unnamed protein product [Rotaria socialis]
MVDVNMHISSQRKETINKSAQLQQEGKETINNDDRYVLIANERIKISPLHAFNIEVKPIKPFSITDDDEENEYEVTSIKETPCVANGIITPR